VEKLHKNTIKWIGGNDDPELERDITQMKKQVEELME